MASAATAYMDLRVSTKGKAIQFSGVIDKENRKYKFYCMGWG